MNNNITIEDILEAIREKYITKVYDYYLLHGHYISYYKNNPCKHLRIFYHFGRIRINKNRFNIK